MTWDPTTVTLLLALYPAVAAFALWYAFKKNKGKKQLWFLLGFLCLNLFYIFAPDPSLIQKMYVEGGDLAPVFEFATISAFFLFISVYFFKKHLKGEKE